MKVELLLKRIEEGDEKAFASLVNIYTKTCFRIAWRQVFDVQVAEDIVQEVMLKLWQKPMSWQSGKGCKFETWLFRVIVNRCIDHKRRNKNQHQFDSYDVMLESGVEVSSMNYEPESFRLKIEEQQLLHLAIERLDERARVAMNLFYYEKFSQKRIAEIMDTTPKAVESLVARARKELKEIYNELETDRAGRRSSA